MNYLWGGQYLLTFEDLESHKYIIETMFTGGIGSCFGRSLVEIFSTDFLKQPAGIGNHPTTLGDQVKIKKGNILNSDIQGFEWKERREFKSTSTDPVVSYSEKKAEIMRELIQKSRDVTYLHNIDNEQKINNLQKCNRVEIGLDSPVLYEIFGDILKLESQASTRVLQQRMNWIGNMYGAMNFLNQEDWKEYTRLDNLLSDNLDKYNSNLSELTDKFENNGDVIAFYRQLHIETNAFRNKNTPLVNRAENIFQDGFRRSIYGKSPIFRELIFKDYIEGKQKFNKEEQYLKKKVSEALDRAKRQ